jgi:hypothetical protein
MMTGASGYPGLLQPSAEAMMGAEAFVGYNQGLVSETYSLNKIK